MQTAGIELLYGTVLFLGGFVSVLAIPAGIFLGLDSDSNPVGQQENS
jgi:hypothetical protein